MRAGQILCEIETDKASIGFEIQEDSVLAKILYEAQQPELACGEPMCLTGTYMYNLNIRIYECVYKYKYLYV
jgi:pyruvate/2-oxoglutarate dehydrogenase complex dihydrolipoamide acyltransferase (E2) component